nr:MAG TPA: hypothetical protein [Caudoviricetes sp.]
MNIVNCLRCRYRHPDNGNCTAIGGFCTAVPASHCQLLHDYLDIGLTPEQTATAKTIIESAFSDDTSKAERIRELLKADEEGRAVVLPCKVGDRIYRIQEYFNDATLKHEERIKACTVGSVSIDSFATDDMLFLPFDRIGKTVFHTREEAAKTLEAKKKRNHGDL